MAGCIRVSSNGNRLLPVAVLTGKWSRPRRRRRILSNGSKWADLFNKVGIVACYTVLRVRQIRIVMPLPVSKLYILPAMASACQAVRANRYPVFTVRGAFGACLMAWITEMVVHHHGYPMVSGCSTVTVTGPATRLIIIRVAGVVSAEFLRNIVH